MAALLEATDPTLWELRKVRADQLEPFLTEEIAQWKERLDWNFRPSADLVRRCQERLVEGSLWFLDLSLIEFGHFAWPSPESNRVLARAAERIRDLWTVRFEQRG